MNQGITSVSGEKNSRQKIRNQQAVGLILVVGSINIKGLHPLDVNPFLFTVTL
ncbi:hypothetical protein [Desulfovibrio sp. JC022]|uniref:hypothetical protein n=1 Tax=Desulfovibrio sp. JC022 TaxID=2593642 RepID=UPI0013D860D8|nr:hypothetical protein [Desulfovibrio sp. JC022]